MEHAIQIDCRNRAGSNSAHVHQAWNQLWSNDEGQDVAEYSIMLAVVLVIVVGTVRLIGSNAGNIFSQVGSSIQ
jgi:Flp pilus assembly pilin Flp